MNVLHFVITDGYSGAESVACHIIKALPDGYNGYYCAPDGEGIRAARSLGVKTVTCDTSSVGEIRRVCKELAPCVVHAHDPHMSFLCARAGVGFVSHLHSNCPWLGSFCPNTLALAYTVKKAGAVISVSDSIENEFLFKGLLKKKDTVLHNRVDSGEVLRLAAEADSIKYDLCCVGRLTRLKRPDLFVRLVAAVKEQIPDVTAVSVGDGELRGETVALARSLGLQNNIDFVGFQNNPYKFVAESRLGVLTSSHEGFGLAAAEALLLGLPFLCYPVGGLPDIVDDSCGKLCDSEDEMAAEAVRLLRDTDLYTEKSEAARQKSAQFTDYGKYISLICAKYDRIFSPVR